jgi:uncharacterized protein YwqG
MTNQPTSQANFRIIYHKNVDAEHHPTEVKMSENAEFPFEGEFVLAGVLGSCPMSPEDYRYNNMITNYFEKHGLKYNRLAEGIFHMEFDILHSNHHMISGYPSFAQTDPRDNDAAFEKFDTLLLQLTSEGGLCWGDMGVLNFHIPMENLKRLDFSEVLYNFDCC